MEGQCSRCKIVVVGDTQCGKTALLHVFAKDSYPEVNASCYLSFLLLKTENKLLNMMNGVVVTIVRVCVRVEL